MKWEGRSVLVTGAASFIWSHPVDGLIDRGAVVRVVDDLSFASKDRTSVRADFERRLTER